MKATSALVSLPAVALAILAGSPLVAASAIERQYEEYGDDGDDYYMAARQVSQSDRTAFDDSQIVMIPAPSAAAPNANAADPAQTPFSPVIVVQGSSPDSGEVGRSEAGASGGHGSSAGKGSQESHEDSHGSKGSSGHEQPWTHHANTAGGFGHGWGSGASSARDVAWTGLVLAGLGTAVAAL